MSNKKIENLSQIKFNDRDLINGKAVISKLIKNYYHHQYDEYFTIITVTEINQAIRQVASDSKKVNPYQNYYNCVQVLHNLFNVVLIKSNINLFTYNIGKHLADHDLNLRPNQYQFDQLYRFDQHHNLTQIFTKADLQLLIHELNRLPYTNTDTKNQLKLADYGILH